MLGAPQFSELDDDSDIPGIFEPTEPRGPGRLEEPGRNRRTSVAATRGPWSNRDGDSSLGGGSMLPHGSTQFGVGRQGSKDAKEPGQDGSSTSFGLPTARKPLSPAHAPKSPETVATHGKRSTSSGAVHRRTAVGLPRLDAEGKPSLEKTWVPGVTDHQRPEATKDKPARTMALFGLGDAEDAEKEKGKETWVPGVSKGEGPRMPAMTSTFRGHAVDLDEPSADSGDDDVAPPPAATQAGLGAAFLGPGGNRAGSRPPNRRTLLGAPPVSVGEDEDSSPPMTQAMGYNRLEPKRRKPKKSTDLGPARPGRQKTEERGPIPGSGLFKFPPRKSSDSTPPPAEPQRSAGAPRSTLLGTPALDAKQIAEAKQASASKPKKESSPGAYVFKKADISRSSQAVRISSSLSARRLTPPSQRALAAGIGSTQQISIPAFGDLAGEIHQDPPAVEDDGFADVDFDDSGAQFGDDDEGLFGDLDASFADDAIATLGGAADLVDQPGQLPPSEDEGDATDVQAFRPELIDKVEGGRTMQIALPGAAVDESGDGAGDLTFGDDDDDSPAATIQMMLPREDAPAKAGLAHADTSELDQISDAWPPAGDELADTADNLQVDAEVVAAAQALDPDRPAPARSDTYKDAPPGPEPDAAPLPKPPPAAVGTEDEPEFVPGPTTAVAARATSEPSETVVRLLGGAAGVAMLLGVVFQVLATGADQFASLSKLTQVSMAFPVLGGLLVLGTSLLRFPAGMRALIIGLVGVIATMLVAATDLAPLGDLGSLARRGAMVASFALPMALLWRARYPQAFTSRIVAAAGILMVVANFAFLDFFLGDLGKPLAVVLVNLAGQGAVGAIVAGLAAVPVLLVLPSLMAFRGSHTDGLGSVWAGLYLAWTLMMPVAAGALAVQTTGSPTALLAYAGAGLAVFAAATAFSVGFAETFGRLTTLPER